MMRTSLRLSFAEIDDGREVWEYAVLVSDRADSENSFDELNSQWGWGGFTTRDLKRCRLMASYVALVFNWWNLFVRLSDPNHHREAITSRPLLLQAIGRQTRHAGRTTETITSSHGEHHRARQALTRIAGFFTQLRKTAEQLTAFGTSVRVFSARPYTQLACCQCSDASPSFLAEIYPHNFTRTL